MASIDKRSDGRYRARPRRPSTSLLQPVLAHEPRLHARCGGMIPVQDVRVEIDAVRPTDRSGDTVHRRPSERRVVIDRGQNPGKLAHEVELPHQSVRERHTKRAGAEVLDIGYSGERGHNHRLLEGLDRGQGGRLLRRQPVRYQFVVMERPPLLAHASRSSGPGSPSTARATHACHLAGPGARPPRRRLAGLAHG